MSRRKPRGLRADEKELWQRVTVTATPLHRKPAHKPEAEIEPQTSISENAPSSAPEPFRIGSRTPAPINGKSVARVTALGDQSVNMDSKTFARLKRGKLKPEARLDLHGKSLAQAHPALTAFIFSAHSSGKRLVLVITGKGKEKETFDPIPVRRGVLRHQVPDWLRSPPLGSLVLQVTPAHLRHGGEGAYYVYLRRSGR
ncbi:MAG: Smr/MutS family protein [Pseudomonadota bacterium]